MGIDYNKQRKDREDNNGASGESIGAAVLLFAISFLGKKAEWFLNLVLRSVFGVIFMYFLNWGIEILGFTVAVGINAATALTVGILGFPGILVLYGLAVYHML
mgnify:CR=1 FL=1